MTVTAQQLAECYARTFTLGVASPSITLNGEEDNPSSLTASATVNATFGLSDSTTSVHNACQVSGITTQYSVSIISPTGDTTTYPAASSTNPNSTYGSSPQCNSTVPVPISNTSAVSMPPLEYGDSICLTVSVNPTGTQIDYAGTIITSNGQTSQATTTTCKTVAADPYLKVFGGDVLAGPSSDYIASCYDQSSGIYSWNQAGSGGYGAGTTAAALATGSISGFASGQNVLNLLSPSPLTFSNDPATEYGGNFGTGGSCGISDYYSWAQSMPGAIACPSTISAMALGPNDHYLCYSTSPVTITGNISYNIPSGTPVSQLPSLEIITKGADINIESPGVHNLAGTYIAEGATIDDTGGELDICSAGVTDNAANTCSNDRLVIDGSFIANQIDLYRTYGTLHEATNASSPPDPYAAEEFDYTPLNWLTPGNQSPVIQSITSLPPVL